MRMLIPKDNCGAVSGVFLRIGITDFRAACEFVKALPYGRTTVPENFVLVIQEGKGTCSSKHALLAAFGAELGMTIRLMIGIYEMNEANTPGVGAPLAEAGFSSLPEAHCYLLLDGERRDFTSSIPPAQLEILQEEEIRPDQIGGYKRNFHREYIRKNYGAEALDQIWAAREACIATLASRNCASQHDPRKPDNLNQLKHSTRKG